MYEELPKFVRDPNPAVYLSNNYLVLDVETTNKEHGSALEPSNGLLLACWTLGRTGQRKAVWADEFSQHELLADLATVDFLVCHNTKFELGYLRRCGLDLRKVLCFDTLIAEKVLAGNRKIPLSLEATAARRGLGHKEAVVSKIIKAGVCPSHIPTAMLETYCCKDVSLTEQVFLAQRQELSELALLPVAYCRNLVTPVLADIEFAGMTLDPDKVQETFLDYSERYVALEKQFAALTGGINPKSGKQMRKHIYEKLAFEQPTDHRGNGIVTAGGKAKTDKATIGLLRAVTDEQKEFKRLAVELAKLKVPVQNLKKMQGICDASPDDPRVFASFNQTVTATDRLSSTARRGGFQFQNLERAQKRLFRARERSKFMVEVDGSQLEFRVAAYLGRDEAAKKAILNGDDVHAVTASIIGCNRQDAKAWTFKPLFGGRSGTPKQRAYIKYFNDTYSGISRTQSKWAMDAASNHVVVTEWGLRFYFPEASIQQGGYVTGQTQIYNFPIQSLATACIIPLCLRILWDRTAHMGEDCVIVNTVHDSVIAEVSVDRLVEYKAIAAEVFTKDIYLMLKKLYNMTFDVPLGAAMKAGESWGSGEEEKYESSTDR